MTPTYAEYLRSDAWHAIRDRYARSRRPQACVVCGSQRFQLHHVSYENLGRERLADLVPLCEKHHTALHQYARAHRWLSLRQATVQYLRRARLLVTDDGAWCDDDVFHAAEAGVA